MVVFVFVYPVVLLIWIYSDVFLTLQTASEAIENVRTVQSLSRESDFYNKYTGYLLNPYK